MELKVCPIYKSMNQNFYSLVREPAKRKTVKCLKCGKEFISRGSHNRQCSTCLDSGFRQSRMGARQYA